MLSLKRFTVALAVASLWCVTASAQLFAPNRTGVSMGHLHYYVRDVEVNKRFWTLLGGQAIKVGGTDVMKFPGVLVFLSGILIQGIATAVYIGVDAGAGPRDSLMLAIQRTTGVSIRLARGAIEVIVVFIGWLLGGPLGFGTVIFALLIGPSVQWAFRLFNVHPHTPEPVEAAAD